MKTKLLLLTLMFTIGLMAQDGTNDLSFNSNDIGNGNGDGPNNSVNGCLTQPDGKILIFGSFNTYDGQYARGITRLNSNFTRDNSFYAGNGATANINGVVIQSDGKIIIVGAFFTFNGVVKNNIAQLNSDGSVDSTFNSGVGTNGNVQTIETQPDGRIIIAGDFTTYNGQIANRILRINANGSIDANFDAIAGANNSISSTSIQPNGKVLVVGSFTNFNGLAINRIVRLNANGSIDNTFSVGLGSNASINHVKYQSNNKILISGYFTSFNGLVKNRICNLNDDGTIDSNFDVGTGLDEGVTSTYTQTDGKIIVVGYFKNCNNISKNNIVRLNVDGSIDNSFIPVFGPNNVIKTTNLINGKLIVSGDFTLYDYTSRNRITQINYDGTIDTNAFVLGTGVNGDVNISVIQIDGKILIGGNFTAVNGFTKSKMARLNANGSLDNAFISGLGFDNGTVEAIAIQNDGKIIVGGSFRFFNGISRRGICRLNVDGSLDANFIVGTGVNNYINTVSIQSDGKIIIAGLFQDYNEFPRRNIARLNPDGSLDNSFISASDFYGVINTSVIQSDGKIIVGGDFTTYSGTLFNSIARLNNNGTIDITFNAGTGIQSSNFSGINKIVIQPDNKILLAGKFLSYNNIAVNGLARLSSTGVLEQNFQPIPGGSLLDLALLTNGQIIIVGGFSTTTYSGPIRIARINNDGIFDNSFSEGLPANNAILTAAIQNDGKIFIGGAFTDYSSSGRNRIARINNNVLENKNYSLKPEDILITKVNGGIKVTTTNIEMKSIIIFDITGKTIFELEHINSNDLVVKNLIISNQILFLKIKSIDDKIVTKKFIN